MRYILWGVGALLALLLIIALVGWTLPVRHRATREAVFDAPPATLFALITDAARFPTWRSKVRRVELLDAEDGRPRFREIGGDGTITYRVEELVPDRKVVTRIADRSLPFGGSWTYELTPAGTGTSLRITEDGEVYNPIFRFVSRFVMGHHATIDAYLDDVARRVGRRTVPD